jgi:hypothetical protein
MQAAIVSDFTGTVNAVVVAYFAGAVYPIVVMPGLMNAMVITDFAAAMYAMIVTRFGVGAAASGVRGCIAGVS